MKEIEFSPTAALVLEEAKAVARRIRSGYADSRHIFIALYTVHRGVAYSVMLKHGLRAEDFQKLAEMIRNQSEQSVLFGFTGTFTERTQKLMKAAKEDAARLKAENVGTELLLLAVLRDLNSDVYKVLQDKNVRINQMCIELLSSYGLSNQDSEKYVNKYVIRGKKKESAGRKKTMLETYGRDLTAEAKEMKLDPVVGRQDEIVRVLQILGRRTKNNACLVGEPGVGKTAIVEGIAQLIQNKLVPESMENKKIVSLDLAGMLAGTRYRGDFEERLKNTIDELKNNPDVILFIDELHTLIGAGGSEGTHDAANIFKPALSRGEIHVIGATTLEEYRKYIEKDAALERRFQPENVEEPTREETIEILNVLAFNYQRFHGVSISEEAIVAAVDMSIRYINDRFLPDKAIDLMDEACSRKKMGNIVQSLFREYSDDSEWFLNTVFEKALAEGDIDKAARFRNQIKEKRDRHTNTEDVALKEITPDDIAEVVSVWTKIPVSRLSETEQQKLLNLEKNLHERVIGQEEAVSAVAKAIKRGRAGLRNPSRPIGSFLFLGPTGVGKTELSKALAERLFGDEKNLIRVDMSEYMEKHSVSKMIGSPPGYVGYDEGGQLSEKVRRNPYSVILFDEVEKAHPDVFNIMLQVLDDGMITDSQGRKVDFKNTIIIMTSNLGADRIIDPKTLGFVTDNSFENDYNEMKSRVMDEVKKLFKPEFLNRLDDIIVFSSLKESEVYQITDLMLKELKNRVEDSIGIKLSYGKKLKDYIFAKGYDKKFGARPLRRAIQQYVEDPMAEGILRGDYCEGDRVTVSVAKGEVTFTVKSPVKSPAKNE